MSTSQLKKVLKLRIEQADEKLLRLMYAITAAYNLPSGQEITDEYINSIAPSESWKPMSKAELLNEIQEADSSIEAGDYITLEDLEKEMRQW